MASAGKLGLFRRRSRPKPQQTFTVSSPRRRDGPWALTSSAARLDVSDRAEAKVQRMLRQGWQSDAWNYRDQIGELRYAVQFLANCTARMRIFPACYPSSGEADEPVSLANATGIPASVQEQLTSVCAQAMADLGNGRMAISGLLHRISSNKTVTGEWYLLGRTDEQSGREVWSARSVDELVVWEDKWHLREIPDDRQNSILPWIPLDPALTVISRVWTPHPRFELLADSALKAMLDDCESLTILRRIIRATGRSRLAGRGLLLVPDELSIKVPVDDDSDPDADPFMSALAQAMMAPVENEGTADGVVPIVIRGPGDALDKMRLIDLATKFDDQASKNREELIGVIGTSLDLPKEVIVGVADLNHWSAWQVDDNTFRHHVEPHVIACCDDLSGAYLRPYLTAAGIPDEFTQRMVLWYDPVELVSHPDRTADAQQLHDRLVISDEALRRGAGFADEDAPTKAEIQVRLLEKMRNWPPNLVMAFLHQWDPTIVAPPITVAGTIPGIKPTGVDVGEPPELPPGQAPPPAITAPGAAPEPEKAALPPGPPPADRPLPAPPPQTASAAPEPPNYRPQDTPAQHCGSCRMNDAGACWGYGNKPIEADYVCDSWAQDTVTAAAARDAHGRRLSRRLCSIDSDLRARLQTAANAAMLRQLERAGARLRTKVAKDETLRSRIAHRANERVAALLGPDIVAAAGLSASELVGSDWSGLRAQFDQWTEAAQRQALATALQIGKLDADSDAAAQAETAMAQGRDAAWQLLSGALSTLGHHLLYSPDPNAGPGDWADLNPDTLVPAGTIRAALAVAGGASATQVAVDESGAVALQQPVGQIGTGSTISDLISGAGGQTAGYEWVHGPSLEPFPPHEDLDGVQFANFDDEALANPGDFPDNQYFMPGDHDGCVCDFMPLYQSPSDSE